MKPTLIACADLHFRDSQPTCRLDNFWETQIGIMKWLKEIQEKYDVPLICSGDYFHHWKPSPRLLSACIEYMPFVYTIPGNHDLPNHNSELFSKSGLFTLFTAGKTSLWLTKLENMFHVEDISEKKVGIIHKLINHPQSDTSAKAILKKYKDYNLIISGDNHEHFIEKVGDRLLINPGSISRQTAAQVDHKPCVVLWDAESGKYEHIYLPIAHDVISREHLAKAEERDERMEAFVNKLKGGYEIELDFEANLKAFFENNRTRKAVEKLVWESMEAE